MKKIIVLLLLAVSIMACKDSEEKKEGNIDITAENSSQIRILKGEFLYLDNAAVLKGTNFIYGVNLDEMAHKLADQVAPVKRDQYDMVLVSVKGTVAKKLEGAEGWDEILTIEEILSVSATPSDADVKIEEKKS